MRSERLINSSTDRRFEFGRGYFSPALLAMPGAGMSMGCKAQLEGVVT